MENQPYDIGELNFQPRKLVSVEKQRKIFEYYARTDHDRQRKVKTQLFTKKTIEGFMSILQISPNRLDFINQEELSGQISTFLLNSKKIYLEIGEQILIKQNQFYILFEGCLVKKQDPNNHPFLTQFNKKIRNSRRDSKKSQNGSQKQLSKGKQTFISAVDNVNLKKIAYKRIQSDENLSPQIIFYDSIDTKPYQCRTNCTLFEFSRANLQKLNDWVGLKERESLINFLSVCFGINDQKSLSKLIQKISKLKILNKCKISLQPRTIYLIYSGEILLKTKSYQLSLTKNSIIFRDVHQQDFELYCKNQETLIISLQFSNVVQILEESFSHILKGIKNKLSVLHRERKQLLERIEIPVEKQKEIEPIFHTQLLNIRSYQRNKKYQSQNIPSSPYISPRYLFSNLSSARFRIRTSVGNQNLMQDDQALFISNYPYQKIVESEMKVHKLKKSASGKNKKQNLMYEAKTEEQKKKVQKQRKKLYYMNKVIKMKIRNIAARQIPNGHKKKFNVQAVEKEIQTYSLFTNFIQYPTNGISEDAKETIVKNITKIMGLTSLQQRNRKNQRKTMAIEEQESRDKSSSRDFSLENGKNFQKTNLEESFNSTFKEESSKKKKTNTSEELYENQVKSNLFYLANNLKPHLPTQRGTKSRLMKTTHNIFEQNQRQNINPSIELQQILKLRKKTQNSTKNLSQVNIKFKALQPAQFHPPLRHTFFYEEKMKSLY